MPGYKGHIAGGVIAFGLLLLLLQNQNPSIYTSTEWLVISILGALFPDIDIKSKGQNIFYSIVLGVSCFLLIQQQFFALSLVLFVALMPLFIRHRGILHNIWFILFLVLSVLAYAQCKMPQYFMLVTYNCLFFMSGVISHLILDLGIKRMWRR